MNGSLAGFAAAVDRALGTDTAASLSPYAESPYAGATLVFGPAHLLMRMPDGSFAWGAGSTVDEAIADGLRVWRNRKYGPAMRREYQRRIRARRKRKRR